MMPFPQRLFQALSVVYWPLPVRVQQFAASSCCNPDMQQHKV